MMVEEKRLDAPGKGEFMYDHVHDILTFKIKDRDYKRSVEFQNFVIDIDTEDFVTGIRVFDAAKVSGLDKMVFRNLVHGEFKASIQDNIISVRLKFVGRLRNSLIHIFRKEQNFTQQFSAQISQRHPLEDSVVSVPEIIAS